MCECGFCQISRKAKRLKIFLSEQEEGELVTIVEDMLDYICDVDFEIDCLKYKLSKLGEEGYDR